MAPIKREKTEMSDFERKRLENIAANQAMLRDLSTTAAKIIPKLVERPKKRATPTKIITRSVKRESVRQTRFSSRIAGIGADSEVTKREVEIEDEFLKDQAKAKRQRITGELKFADIIVDGRKFSKDINFLSEVRRGSQPYLRTFTEDDIKETSDKSLKKLREKLSELKLYEAYGPHQLKITPERIYSLCFHQTISKPLVFAGDKVGNIGIFDASQDGPTLKEAGGDEEEDTEEQEPVITAIKIHSKTVTSLIFSIDGDSLYSGSYDSSIRRFDLQKEVAVEAYAPLDIDDEAGITCIDMSPKDPNLLYFTTLQGSLARHDLRTKSDTEIWQISEKKCGGFSLHPLQPHLAATASLDRTLKIWDLRNIKKTDQMIAPAPMGEHISSHSVSHASWSACGHIATSSFDNTVKLYSFTNASTYTIGNEFDENTMKPSAVIQHNNKTGRWVTILKPRWQKTPQDGISKLVIGNMNRFVDVYDKNGEQLAQLGDSAITAVPAVASLHPSQDWIAGGTTTGRLCLWI